MMSRLLFLVALTAALLAGPADAQLGGVQLPGLPSTPNVGDITRALPNVGSTADNVVSDLRSVRRNTVDALLSRHRDVLEADPAGNPIIRNEVLVIAPSQAALTHATALGFATLRRDEIEGAGALIVLQAPRGVTTAAALEMLRRADPDGVYDFDHLNLPSGEATTAPASAQAPAAGASAATRVGLIDGGVGAHPSLDGAVAEQRVFNGASVTPTAHATAVASLLVGRGHGVIGAAPSAQVYVADIYGGDPTGGSSASLARAFGWLTSLGVPVINVSLVGPRNRVVETIVASAVRRGFLIVAAVGNDGPSAPPLYPAAYPGVVGVTGVDTHDRALVEAERGPQVEFSGLGIVNAASFRGTAPVRGTSFAAPIVAGVLAAQSRSVSDTQTALQSLRHAARDLGAPGRDDVYGYGLVGGAALLSGSR